MARKHIKAFQNEHYKKMDDNILLAAFRAYMVYKEGLQLRERSGCHKRLKLI
jgi:hypothetical protein